MRSHFRGLPHLHPARRAPSSAVVHLILVRRMRALLVFALFLAACERTWPEGARVASSAGQPLCAKHKTSLVPVRVYRVVDPPGVVSVGVSFDTCHPYWGVAAEHCPNIIPESFGRHPAPDLKPLSILYCPTCEKEFWQELSVPEEKSAIAYATYVLSIRAYTEKGPTDVKRLYQVSLKGNIWTAQASMADGREGTIKFTKSDGCTLSTHYSRPHASNQTMQLTPSRTASTSHHG